MLIGRRINDRYKIIEKIGGGGMADVYLARDVILERYVAVKILRLDFSNNEEFIRRFHREAQSATSLVHPNIVSIYDVGEEDDNIYYIVMEYVNGETLKQYIQNHSPIPVNKAIDIMQQLVSAIKHAHQNNIIHRDIKPQNILIDKKGTVKVTDFGIVTALTSTTITQTNSLIGSVHYISPEQARGATATKKSDIYSLGIVLFEMLTGRLPFSGESPVSIALKHLQDETPSPKKWNPQIPQSVENIIIRATAKDPYYRYDDIEELEDDLLTCLNPERLNEEPYRFPSRDDEPTKAIPIITDELLSNEKVAGSTGEGNVKSENDGKNEKGKRKIWPIALIAASTLIVIVGILAITVFPKWFFPKEIEIPDVSGLEVEEAIEILEDLGFKIGETTRIPDNEIPENHVIRTDPRAGRKVVEESEINLYVSTGKETMEMPDYIGRNYEEVLAIIQAQGIKFKDIKSETVYDDEAEKGIIISHLPEPGDEFVPEETVLIFKVSQGRETFILDDLTNYSENALKTYAETKGIKIVVESEEYHDTIPAGLVISQDPEPNTEIEKGSIVNVIISKGKELKPKQVDIPISVSYPGEPDEEGNLPELELLIYIEDMNHDGTTPVISEKITADFNYVIRLEIAPESTARYKVVLDGKVIEDVDIPYSE